MLNSEENNLINIFLEVYSMNINNFIDLRLSNFNIIFDTKHIPDKLINIFFKKSKDYLNIILETSILYSLGYSEKKDYMKYINFIEYYKKDINNIDLVSNEFKRLTVYNSIKFLIDKKKRNVDLYKLDKFKEDNFDTFSYINNNIKIYTINDIEKNTIWKILCKYDLINIEKTIKEFITTNKYDKDIEELSNNFITSDDDILFFKKYIIRKILFDTFIIEIFSKDEYIKELKKIINNKNILNTISNTLIAPIDEHINTCINNNKYYLPKNKELLDIVINRYAHCFYYPDKEKLYIKNAIINKEKQLKKINPYYKLW